MNRKLRIFLSSVMAVATFAFSMVFTACGGDDDKYTVANRAKELAENIEKLPDVKDILSDGDNADNSDVKQKNNKKVASAYSATDNVIDISVPDQGYYDGSYYVASYENINAKVSSYISEFKYRKEVAIDKLKQLNTWVHVSDGGYDFVMAGHANEYPAPIQGSEDYKLSYDKANDVATVEYRHDAEGTGQVFKRYLKMFCSYNGNGNAVISASYHYANNQGGGYRVETSTSVHYVENESWLFIEKTEVAQYTFYADLKTGDLVILQKDINGIECLRYDVYTKSDNTKLLFVNNKHNIEYNINLPEDGSQVIVFDNSGRLLTEINNSYKNFYYQFEESGTKLYYEYETGNRELITDVNKFLEKFEDDIIKTERIWIPIYKLSGWDKFYFVGENFLEGEYFLEINGKTYQTSEIYSNNEFNWVLRKFGNNNEIGIELQYSKSFSKKYSQTVSEFLNKLGLSYERSDLSFIDDYCGNAWEAIDDVKILGYSLTDLNLELYENILDNYFYGAMEYDEMKAILDVPAISLKKQKAENEVFSLIDITVSSNAELNEQTGVIDFSSVSATVPKSVLLNENTEYSLVLALRSDSKLIESASVSEKYNNEQFVLQGFGSVDLKSIVTDGDYNVVAFIAKNSDGNNERLSQFYNITSSKSNEYINQWKKTENKENKTYEYDYTYLITASAKSIDVSQYYMISISNSK